MEKEQSCIGWLAANAQKPINLQEHIEQVLSIRGAPRAGAFMIAVLTESSCDMAIPNIVSPQAFLELAKSCVVLDVRSPREFQQGHLPGAISIPLFSDEERAVVGTTYNHRGRITAIDEGL